MKGKVDFTRLGQEFLNPDTLLVEGVMDADLSTTFTVNDPCRKPVREDTQFRKTQY